MKDRLAAWLNLRPAELGTVVYFWLFYGVLVMMLQWGESLSVSLFLKRVGVEQLPVLYMVVAVLNVVCSTLYTFVADRMSNRQIFVGILALSGGSFLLASLLSQWTLHPLVFALFFIVRDVSFTMLILHFGLYIRDFYNSADSERMFPVIYASGRVGGLAAGVLIGTLSPLVGTLPLTYLYPLLSLVAIGLLYHLEARFPPQEKAASPAPKTTASLWSPQAGWRNFMEGLRFVKTSQLLITMSIATALFVVLRYFLNLQYSTYFNETFPNEDQLTQFLGYFSTVALLIAMLVQLVATSRLVKRWGVGMVNLLFSGVMAAAAWGMWLFPGLPTAMGARFVETELRMCLRNPVMNMFYNAVPDAMRARARAFTFGMVLPPATLLAGALLYGLEGSRNLSILAVLGALLGLCFVYFSWRQAVAYRTSKEALSTTEQAAKT
jgi:ATP/ADP translocase